MELDGRQLPRSSQILDCYHAKEKLVLFGKDHYKDDSQRKLWLQQRQNELLNLLSGVEYVIENFKAIRVTAQFVDSKQKAIDYYLNYEDLIQNKIK